jgi:hypothetical protein
MTTADLMTLFATPELAVDLRKPLSESVEDMLTTYGLEVTLMELEKHQERIKRLYAADLTEPQSDDARGVARDDWFRRHRKPSGLLGKVTDGPGDSEAVARRDAMGPDDWNGFNPTAE